MVQPFRFSTSLKLTEITGVRARDLEELLDGIRKVDGSVIFNHTHHFLLKHQYWLPQPPSDFAFWVGEALQERKLEEELNSIDTIETRTIRQLRERIVKAIEDHMALSKRSAKAPPGMEFNFLRAHSFIIPTRYQATGLREFYDTLQKVSLSCVYHHMFEARLRLERETNDFSYWLRTEVGEESPANEISRLDPYVFSMVQLRERILDLVKHRLEGAR